MSKWIKKIYDTNSLPDEEWRYIEYSKYYYASNLGRIKTIDRYEIDISGRNMFRGGKILRLIKDNNGYTNVRINGKKMKVHRLVAKCFILNIENKPFIDHINTIRNDNKVSNLRWCDRIENANNPISIQKVVNNSLNRKHSALTRKKMSNSKKGRPQKIKVIQIDINGHVLNTFLSMADAERFTGVSRKSISAVILGKIKSTHNYKWKLEDEI